MVWIRILSSRNVCVKFYGVKFHSNNFTLDNGPEVDIAFTLLRIYIKSAYKYKESYIADSRDSIDFEFDILSNVTIESCNFLNNAAH